MAGRSQRPRLVPHSSPGWGNLRGRKVECPDFSDTHLAPIGAHSQGHMVGLRLEQLAPDFSEVKVIPS